MSTTAYKDWVADLGAMTCRNTRTRVVVEFEKFGIGYSGKIKDVPFEIIKQWAKTEQGVLFFRRTVEEAEEVFFKACTDHGEEGKNQHI